MEMQTVKVTLEFSIVCHGMFFPIFTMLWDMWANKVDSWEQAQMVAHGIVMVIGTSSIRLHLHLHLPLQVHLENWQPKKVVGYSFQTNARILIMIVEFTLSSTKPKKMQISLLNQENTTSLDISMTLSWCTHKQRNGICRQTLQVKMRITKMEFYQVW